MLAHSSHEHLPALIKAGLKQVDGRICVANALRRRESLPGNIGLVAMGKAALSMAEGAVDVIQDRLVSGLLISKEPVSATDMLPQCIKRYTGGHPIPDQRSLHAGQALLRYLEACPAELTLLFLISGGASALVEVLPETVTLQQLEALNLWLLGSGLDIEKMNAVRQCVSRIKAGRLANYVSAPRLVSLLMSDIRTNDESIIGSGLLTASSYTSILDSAPEWVRQICAAQPPRPDAKADVFAGIDQEIVADLDMALQAIAVAAKDLGYAVHHHGVTMRGDVECWADYVADYLVGAPAGLHVWGGETVLRLPDAPGRGGRNTHLALSLALRLSGRKDVTLALVASDGDDGNSGYAGALVDGATLRGAAITLEKARQALTAADSATLLREAKALLSFAKGRCNVADICLAIKQ